MKSVEEFRAAAAECRRREILETACREQAMVHKRILAALAVLYLGIGSFVGFAVGYIIGKG